MLNITDKSIIYIHCPSGAVTGGAELLHQLASFLRDNGRDARIVYFGEAKHVVPDDYSQYSIVQANTVIDENCNIEVFYEGIFHTIHKESKTQKFLWWISVDNFYICEKPYLPIQTLLKWNFKVGFRELLHRAKAMIRNLPLPKEKISIEELVSLNAICGYQAEYIQHFLVNCGFSEILPLKDYINTDHCHSFEKCGRDNIVIYNPKKGKILTQKIIERAKDITFVPLIKMNREQLISTIRKAKVYIDFGEHPGKDRLPRECAMNGCCVITGKRGSAGFFEDVAIPPQYKFDEDDIPKIISKIKRTLVNYDNAINDFDFYRFKISREQSEFERQIEEIFL